jgi:dTDP-4-dehydrorhamnose reductase
VSKKIIITGTTGYLGGQLCEKLLSQGHIVVGVGRGDSPSFTESYSNYQHIKWGNFNCEIDADVIVHTAAITAPSLCESDPEMAWGVNVGLTERVIKVAVATNAYVIFCSTDLVFEGYDSAPEVGFRVSDIPIPKSVYSRTKRYAEELMLQVIPERVGIMRLSLMYGASVSSRGGPLKQVEESLQKNEIVQAFYDEWRTPIFIEEAVRTCVYLIKNKIAGIHHCCGQERLSRLELLQRLYPQYLTLIKGVSRLSYTGNPPRAADVSLHSTGYYGFY